MVAIGIVIGILGYAVMYAGIQEIRSGQGVGIAEVLRPGFVPPPAAGAGKPKQETIGIIPGLPFHIGPKVHVPGTDKNIGL